MSILDINILDVNKKLNIFKSCILPFCNVMMNIKLLVSLLDVEQFIYYKF